MAEPLKRPPYFPLIGVRCFAGQQRFDEGSARRICELLRERARQVLDLAIEREPEVLDGPDDHQPFPAPLPLKNHIGPAFARVAPNRALRNLRPFDAGARVSEAVGEVPQ